MIRIAAVADCHIGNHKRHGGTVEVGANERCRHTLLGLEHALQIAIREQCVAFIVAGDLFDYTRPEAQVIAHVQRLLAHARDQSSLPMPILLLRGNHEAVSIASGDNALAPLHPVAEVIDQPIRYGVGAEAEIGCIPFMPGSATMWLPDAVKEAFSGERKAKRFRVLVVHLGIADDATAPWLKGAEDAVHLSFLEDLCQHWQIGLVLAGNWHERREWTLCNGRTRVQQIGALTPTGWDNPGLAGYGGVAVLELDGKQANLRMEEVEGPRFVKCSATDDKLIAQAKKYAGPVYLQATAAADGLKLAHEALQQAVKQGELARVEVLPDEQEIAAAARTAAAAAQSQETLFEALAAYVKNMPLPEGANREAVLQRTRQYLKRV